MQLEITKIDKIMPAVILVAPQMGENIGAAARAMLNFGLTQMRIVAPRDGWPNQKAIDMAAGAFETIAPPQIFETLAGALHDLQVVYATTARPREMIKPVFTPRAAAQDAITHEQNGAKIGFVFGAERTGLTNAEIAQCHNIITAPLNPDFSSLNLAQAVLLIGYEYFIARDTTAALKLEHGKSEIAPHADLEQFLSRLEKQLDEKGFFRSEDLKPTVQRNIRALFTRSLPSEQEIRTLQGILTALTQK